MSRRLFTCFVCQLISINLGFQLIMASSSTQFVVPKRLEGNNETITTPLLPVQNEYNPIDLTEGKPDFKPPKYVRSIMTETIWGDYKFSQYTDRFGEPRLVKALAGFYSKILNRSLDPQNNVIVGIGATEILYATVQSHTEPGDEWIVIEPFYGPYSSMIKSCFGIPKFVTMKSNKPDGDSTTKDWTFDRDEMTRAFNNRTKGIIINSPHNPLGKIFTYEELKFIADLAKRWNTLVVSDEVYEFFIFDDNKYIRMATLPDMFERTITVCSVSKTFAATGYRLGWAYGGAHVVNNLKFIQFQIVYSCPTFIQETFARIFEKELTDLDNPHSYFKNFKERVERKRDYLIKVVKELGMSVAIPEGGFYFVANFKNVTDAVNYERETGANEDTRFIKWMIKNVGIAGLPFSGYYDSENKHLKEEGIRFAFIKADSTLEEVAKRVKKFKSGNHEIPHEIENKTSKFH